MLPSSLKPLSLHPLDIYLAPLNRPPPVLDLISLCVRCKICRANLPKVFDRWLRYDLLFFFLVMNWTYLSNENSIPQLHLVNKSSYS